MNIFGIKLDKLKYGDFFYNIINNNEKSIIFTPNPEILLKIQDDDEFRGFLNKADYLLPDGIGLYIAFQILDNNYGKLVNLLLIPYFFFNLFFRRKYLYSKYGDRICGSDLTKDLIEYAQKESIGIAIIDLFNPHDLKKIASQNLMKLKLKEKFPNAIFNIYIYREEIREEIIDRINKTSDTIMFTTLGMKQQEKILLDLMTKCNKIKVGAGIGSSIDYLIGFQKRAPKIFRIIGLEWLYRLITGPRKIDRVKRIYNAIFVFICKVLITK